METGRYKQAMSFLINPKYIRSDFVIPKAKQEMEESLEADVDLVKEINNILSTPEE